MVNSWKEFSSLAPAIGLPHKQVGGLVVAWTDEEKVYVFHSNFLLFNGYLCCF